MSSGPPLADEAQGRARLRQKAPWFALAAACLVADLVTKWIVFYPLRPISREPVARLTSWWNIVIAYNQGVTFGLASQSRGWLLACATSVVIALLVWQLWTARRGERLRQFALAIIVGGAIGNLYDRSLRPLVEPDTRPGVRDFLDWYAPDHWAVARWLEEHVGSTHWYTSNVADVLIVCGVCLLAWVILTERPQAEPKQAAGASATAGADGPPAA